MLSRAFSDPDRQGAAREEGDVAPALEDLRAELADALERLDDAVEGVGERPADDPDDPEGPTPR